MKRKECKNIGYPDTGAYSTLFRCMGASQTIHLGRWHQPTYPDLTPGRGSGKIRIRTFLPHRFFFTITWTRIGFLAAKGSNKNHFGSLPVSMNFFAIYSKNLQATHTWIFFWGCPYEKKTQKNLTALLGHLVQNIFFSLIKKLFLQHLVEIIFKYH